jgi:hypothetical protein
VILLAATATGVVAILGYAGSCLLWPFGYCWCCSGAGRHARKDGRVFRDCRWCHGSGRRLRVGRRVWNAVRRDRS